MQVPHGMRGSRNFHQGGPGQLTKKGSDSVFFFFFFFCFVLSLFYRSQMVNFKEIYHFSTFQRGSNILPGGGSNFFQGGSNCLLPLETHITCDFPGGSGPPVPPLWIRTCTGYKNGRLNLTFFSQMFQPL